jgi:hypothetical protein
MRVSGIQDSPFLLLTAEKALRRDPETTMNKLSFRMILFILVLSAVHMAAMAPLTDSSLHPVQRQTLTSHRLRPANHLGTTGSEPHVLSGTR